MENATDALIMAASVLLLVFALTISISSFTSLKRQVDDIIYAEDEYEMAKDGTDYLKYLKSNDDDVRLVGIETVISSIRRARKENFDVYICPKTGTNTNGLDKLKVISSKEQKYNYEQNNISMSDVIVNDGATLIKLSLTGEQNKYIEDNAILENLYKDFKNKEFKEYIGIYQNKTEEGVSEANKKTYKIITYVEEKDI